MNILLISTRIALAIPVLVLLFAFFIGARSFIDREKSSPFECGFDPKNQARLPFSTRFFLLAVIFIVFDIEIVLLIPAPLIIINQIFIQSIIGGTLFLFILILGLLHE